MCVALWFLFELAESLSTDRLQLTHQRPKRSLFHVPAVRATLPLLVVLRQAQVRRCVHLKQPSATVLCDSKVKPKPRKALCRHLLPLLLPAYLAATGARVWLCLRLWHVLLRTQVVRG
jgi:hypothetical protein